MNKDLLAKKISNGLLSLQRRFASFMNRKTATCSTLTMKISLIITCCLFILLSGWCLLDALRAKHTINPISIHHINVVPLKKQESNPALIDPALYQRLRAFHHYLDSLHENRLSLYDSILGLRPGLIDSLSLLERIYQQQTK